MGIGKAFKLAAAGIIDSVSSPKRLFNFLAACEERRLSSTKLNDTVKDWVGAGIAFTIAGGAVLLAGGAGALTGLSFLDGNNSSLSVQFTAIAGGAVGATALTPVSLGLLKGMYGWALDVDEEDELSQVEAYPVFNATRRSLQR